MPVVKRSVSGCSSLLQAVQEVLYWWHGGFSPQFGATRSTPRWDNRPTGMVQDELDFFGDTLVSLLPGGRGLTS